METKVVQIKLELLYLAENRQPDPVAVQSVFSVFDDEYFHREAILVYANEQDKAA